jgi:predicted  nucleic acid-binding Zn-ribbon protein
MGAAETEVLTVSRDGVTVEKSFEPDSFPVPAIAFEIESSRDGPTTVRLVDALPEQVDATDVGFHPDYGDEFWSVEGGEIAFEREFQPGESFTTVYAVRESDLDTIDRFLVEPELRAVDPVDEVVGDSSQVVRDVLSGSSESVPGLGDDEEDDDDEEIEPLNLQDPNADDEDDGGVTVGGGADGGGPTANAADGDGAAAGPQAVAGSAAAAAGAGSVVGALAAELQSGQFDEAELALLRRSLGGGDGGGGASTDARIQQLQTDMSDLRAYINALEEFIDENGRGREILDEVQSEMDALDERLAAAEERDEQIEASVSEVEDSVADVRSTVDVFEGSLKDVRETVSGVEDTVDSVEGRLSNVDASVEELESELAGLREDAATAQDVAELEDRIDEVEDEMAADLEQRLGSIESDLEGMREDIQQFAEFRERVQSVFGGVGGGDDE